ncbi:MAG: ABC transporter ATP-binding protein [Candidatus Dojkabacteria bacterium]|nr:ABC transporter ATP-binding protein [Candidatus Dojkabacteria bacterium]
MKQAGNEIAIHRDRIRGTIAGTLLNSVTYLLTPIFLISKVIAEEISVGQFTFFQSKMLDFSRDLDYTIGQVIDVTDAAVYVTYVKDLQELAPVIKSGNQHLISSRNNPPHIELKNVSFKYPNTKKFALKDISLTITPGEEIALVGENGAGKTTLIKLLLRFYDPTSGQILIDGIPLPKLSLEEYYDRIGALFQEYNRYESLTVKQNITLGDSRKQAHAKRITSAARQADAHSFITRLEKGYQQILNKSFTNGTRLSTGQWQKLSIARMFFRDSPILILDEPTASIDAEAEYKIFKRIYRFIQNKTVVIISHRFSTVRNASKIYVIQHGRITESGTHEELIRNEGQYAHAFKLQAEGYQTKEPVLEKAA